MSRRRVHPVLLLAAVGLTLITARLGWWQLDRAAEKQALERQRLEQAAQPVLAGDDLPRAADAVSPLVQRRARLQGRWQGQATVALENRPMGGRTGFYIVTPLQLADGTAVLVQRGWIPRDLQDRTRLAPFDTPAASVVVQGRIAPRVPRLYELGEAGTGVLRQNLDIDAFAIERGLRLRPWVLIQDDEPGAPGDGLQRNWPVPGSGVDKHHGYAFQWFALSALTLGLLVWFQVLRPARPDHAPERHPS
ncbi:MAG: SURF1 family protein [Betaproteobacteria bacterium]